MNELVYPLFVSDNWEGQERKQTVSSIISLDGHAESAGPRMALGLKSHHTS